MKKNFVFLLLLGVLVDVHGADARSFRDDAYSPDVEVNLEALDSIKNTKEYSPIKVEFEAVEEFPALKEREIRDAITKQEQESEARQADIMIFKSENSKAGDKLLSNIAKEKAKEVEDMNNRPGNLGLDQGLIKEEEIKQVIQNRVNEAEAQPFEDVPETYENTPSAETAASAREESLPEKLPDAKAEEGYVKRIVIKGRSSEEAKAAEEESIFSVFRKILPSSESKEKTVADQEKPEEEIVHEEAVSSNAPFEMEQEEEVTESEVGEDLSKPVVMMPVVVEAEDKPEAEPQKKRTIFSMFGNLINRGESVQQHDAQPVVLRSAEDLDVVEEKAEEKPAEIAAEEHSATKSVAVIDDVEQQKPSLFGKISSFFKPYKGNLDVSDGEVVAVQAEEDLSPTLPDEVEEVAVIDKNSPLPVLKSASDKNQNAPVVGHAIMNEPQYTKIILPNEVKGNLVAETAPQPTLKPLNVVAASSKEKDPFVREGGQPVAVIEPIVEDAEKPEQKISEAITKESIEAMPVSATSGEKKNSKDEFLKKVAGIMEQNKKDEITPQVKAEIADSDTANSEAEQKDQKVISLLQKIEERKQLSLPKEAENKPADQEVVPADKKETGSEASSPEKAVESEVAAVVGGNIVIGKNDEEKSGGEIVAAKGNSDDSTFAALLDMFSKAGKKPEPAAASNPPEKSASDDSVDGDKMAELKPAAGSEPMIGQDKNLNTAAGAGNSIGERHGLSEIKAASGGEDVKHNEILSKIRKLKESRSPEKMFSNEIPSSLPSGLELVEKIKAQNQEKAVAEIGAKKISPDKFVNENLAIIKAEDSQNKDETLKIASIEPAKPISVSGDKSELLSIDYQGVDIGLTQFDKDRLAELVQQISNDKSKRLKIVSYAIGEEGKANSARRISLQRAISIRSQMIKAGLDSIRINVQAVGDKAENEHQINSVKVFLLDK